jgi:hypothetical protein
MTSYRMLFARVARAFSLVATVALPLALASTTPACSNLTSPPSPEPIASDNAAAAVAPPAAKPSAPAAAVAPPKPPEQPPIPAPDDVKAPPASAKKTASGLAYRVLTPGKGKESPKATDRVTVHYTGWTTDGKMFDSSVQRGQPATFPLNGVIKGWTEGVQLMKVGDKFRFWIPGAMAYGDTAQGGRPSGMLVFDVELLSIAQAPGAAPTASAPPGGRPVRPSASAAAKR